LTSLVITTRQKKKHLDDKENLPIKVYSKVKEVLIFQVNYFIPAVSNI